MKRFAFFTDDYPAVDSEACYEDQNEHYTGPAIVRLAEYEATGLMPEEVAALKYQIQRDQKHLDTLTKLMADLAKCYKDICGRMQAAAETAYVADVISRIVGMLQELRIPANNNPKFREDMSFRVSQLEEEMQAGGFCAE